MTRSVNSRLRHKQLTPVTSSFRVYSRHTEISLVLLLAGERIANDLLVVAGDQMTVRIGGMGPIDGAEFAPAVHI